MGYLLDLVWDVDFGGPVRAADAQAEILERLEALLGRVSVRLREDYDYAAQTVRYRLLCELRVEAPEDVRGVSEAIAMQLEELCRVWLRSAVFPLAGCLLCRASEKVSGIWYTKVRCRCDGTVKEGLDLCGRYQGMSILDSDVVGDTKMAEEFQERARKFNQLVDREVR